MRDWDCSVVGQGWHFGGGAVAARRRVAMPCEGFCILRSFRCYRLFSFQRGAFGFGFIILYSTLLDHDSNILSVPATGVASPPTTLWCDVTFLFDIRYDFNPSRWEGKRWAKGRWFPTSTYGTLGPPPLDRKAYEEMLAIATKTVNGYADSMTSRGVSAILKAIAGLRNDNQLLHSKIDSRTSDNTLSDIRKREVGNPVY